MDSSTEISDVLHRSWAIHDDVDEISGGDVHHNIMSNTMEEINDAFDETTKHSEIMSEGGRKINHDVLEKKTDMGGNFQAISSIQTEPNLMISSPYYGSSSKNPSALQQILCTPGYVQGYSVSSTYHQPYVSMVRQKKTSALANALQRPVQMTSIASTHVAYVPGYPYGHANSYFVQEETKPNIANNNNEQHIFHGEISMSNSDDHERFLTSAGRTVTSPTSRVPSECGQSTSSSYAQNSQKHCFDLPAAVLAESEVNNISVEQNEIQDRNRNHDETVSIDGDAGMFEDGIRRHETEEKLAENGDTDIGEEDDESEIVVVDEGEDGVAPTPAANDNADVGSATVSGDTKQHSPLERLLMQPVKRPAYQEYQQPFVVAFSAIGNQPQPSGQHQHFTKQMQFYQPPTQQHLARSTPPPGYPQPYGMGMRPHEEETRQIMNLDSQQTHNSSPTSTWNQPYGQMTNLNAYQQRGPNIYAPPVPPSMVHQNGPPGVIPTSNPYYPTPGPPPQHHHIQPQAPMMAPGMHGQQQQQPYYNTQSPLTGTPPTMNYGAPQIPAPQPATNGSAPIFNFSKPRNSNEGSSVNGGGHRRKKHNDLSSPRYNNNGNEDVDASIFPDMTDFPLLDVVQSKAKKDAGRKPCRPHLCEQSRMLISRVCHFHREFIKRLPSRHPLANSPFSKPDQWTSQIMGISLATVRKCIDMAVDEEVFTRCTDKNLVNLTPSERAEREETLSRLSAVFEGEKSLGAGTAGMTIAEYSPRRSYSNTLIRQSTDDKSSNSSYVNGAEYGSSETTLLNLDDHSNHSKDFGTTPTPTTELSNGGQVFEEIGSMGSGSVEGDEKLFPTVETPKRGRPRKAPGTTTKSSKRKESNEDSEISEDREDHEKKTEDEDETNEETEKKNEEIHQDMPERDDDAASSEGTNRSETATPEPEAETSVAKKTRAAARRKNTRTVDEEFPTSTKKKRGSVTAATAGVAQLEDENSDHKMVTRARSRQP